MVVLAHFSRIHATAIGTFPSFSCSDQHWYDIGDILPVFPVWPQDHVYQLESDFTSIGSLRNAHFQQCGEPWFGSQLKTIENFIARVGESTGTLPLWVSDAPAVYIHVDFMEL